MRNQLRVVVSREAAGDLVHLAVRGEQREGRALLCASDSAVLGIGGHLVIHTLVIGHVFHVAGLIDDLTLDRLGLCEGRHSKHDNERDSGESSEHLAHERLLLKNTHRKYGRSSYYASPGIPDWKYTDRP